MKKESIVIHIPHSATFIPEFVRREMLVSDRELQQDTLAFTDWRTRDIFTHVDFPNRIVYPVSRMVCDPERFRSDEQELMSRIGIGVVYERDCFLRPLRKTDRMQRELLLRLYYDPHHRKLAECVRRQIERHGSCLIVDAHSFPATPLPYEPDQSPERPDICIGTCREHTPKVLERRAVRFFENLGMSVSVNAPYSGTMVPMRHWGDPRVQSIMVEINRALYRKPEAMEAADGYGFIKRMTHDFLLCLAG